jgi:hypothetical protein
MTLGSLKSRFQAYDDCESTRQTAAREDQMDHVLDAITIEWVCQTWHRLEPLLLRRWPQTEVCATP